MFIHDIIKIKYSKEGFLPDYPYHLTSDEEMFEGFLNDNSECFFYDMYPCIDDSLKEKYDKLVEEIRYHISQYLDGKITRLPDWVYSYMIGSVIGPEADPLDIHDLLVMMNLDNKDDELTLPAYFEIYKISQKYIRKLKEDERLHRPPTIFGEPHVVKILRLEQINL